MSTKRERYSIDRSPLFRMGNRRIVANILGISNSQLRKLSAGHDNLYSEFQTPKKSGGMRDVENPRRELKVVQARLARLLCRIAPPDYLFCPVKTRCYVTNAAQHCGQREIRSLDIQRFYPSTPARRVYWFFHKILKCTSDIAGLLTSLSTYKEHLPTGSPLSPILAFFSFYDVWQAIADRCNSMNFRLTVYVDDLSISGAKVPGSFLWEIKKLIHGAALRYHKEKHFVDRPAEITGIITTAEGVSVPHRQFKKLRIMKAALVGANSKFQQSLFEKKIRGIQGQITQIQNVRNKISAAAAVSAIAPL